LHNKNRLRAGGGFEYGDFNITAVEFGQADTRGISAASGRDVAA